MSAFFNNPNPFATPLGQLVEKSTDSLSPDDNFAMYFEICDLINEREENGKDAMKAMRKKLSLYSGRNWSVVLKLLKLLELCSNNCNKRFQILLANKDFLQELKAMIGPKQQPPMVVQEKVLYLIQHWATIFKNDVEFKPIESFYAELRTKGVDFPVYDPVASLNIKSSSTGSGGSDSSLNSNESPKFSSNRKTNASQTKTTPTTNNDVINNSTNVVNNNRQYQRLSEAQLAHAAIKLNEEQVAKLNSELDIVECNVQVLNEMLNNFQAARANALGASASAAMEPSTKDIELLHELNVTCREMQKRVTQLIGNITNEGVISEMLRINDDLNNVFLRYDRYERSIQPMPGSNPESAVKSTSPASATDFRLPRLSSSKPDEKPLIDFNDENDDENGGIKTDDVLVTTSKMNSLTLNGGNSSSSNKKPELKKADSNDLLEKDVNEFLGDENEIKEMENWLKSNEGMKFNQELNNQSQNQNNTAMAAANKQPQPQEDLLS